MARFPDLEAGFEKFLALAYGRHIITGYLVLHSIGLEGGGGTGKEVVLLVVFGDGAYNEAGEGAWGITQTFDESGPWLTVNGAIWGISGNKAFISGATVHSIAYVESEADGTVQVTVSTSDSSDRVPRQGLLFRYSDDNNYLYLYYLNNLLQCRKIVAGGNNLLFSVAVSPADGDVLKVVLAGDQIEIWYNGSLQTTLTESFNQTAINHGMMWEVHGNYGVEIARWDDFSAPGFTDNYNRPDNPDTMNGGGGPSIEGETVEAVLYAGETLNSGWHYHPGTISNGDDDPLQGVDSYFPGGSTYSASPNMAVLLPEGIAEDADASKLAVILKTSCIADYDIDGILISIGYSANPARVKADMLKRRGQHNRINWASFVNARNYYDVSLDWEAGDTTNTYTPFTGVPVYDVFGNIAVVALTGAASKPSPTNDEDNHADTRERILADTSGYFKWTIGAAFPTGTGGGSAHFVDETGHVWYGIVWGNGHYTFLANGVAIDGDDIPPYDYSGSVGDENEIGVDGSGNFYWKRNGGLMVIPQGVAPAPIDIDLFVRIKLWAGTAAISSSEISGKRVNTTTQNITQVKRFEAHPAFTGPVDIGTALDYVDSLCASDTQDAGSEIIFLTPEPRASVHIFDEDVNVVSKTLKAYAKDVRERPNRLWAKFRNLDLQFLDQDSVFALRDELFEEVGRPIDPGAQNFASMSGSQAQRLIEFNMRRMSDNYRWCDLIGMQDSFRVLPADVVTVLSRKYRMLVDIGYDAAATEIAMRAGEVANFRLGTNQVETATVIGTITGAGDVEVVVTATGLTGSPITVNVPVLVDDTAAMVGDKIRTALEANATVAAFFSIGGSGTSVVLTKRPLTANDATLNMALSTGTATGLTAAPTSVSTVAGRSVTPFYATWWNRSDYPTPGEDPNMEVVQVTAIVDDDLTILRAQQGTLAVSHNLAGKTYVLGRIPKDFLVIAATRESGETSPLNRNFTLQEYYPDDYRDNDHGSQQPPVGTPPPSEFSCPATPVLRLQQVTVDGIGGTVSKVIGTIHFGVFAFSQSAKIYVVKPAGGPEEYTGLVVEPASGTTTGTFEYIIEETGPYTFRAEVWGKTACGSATAGIEVGDLIINPTNDEILINPASGGMLVAGS